MKKKRTFLVKETRLLGLKEVAEYIERGRLWDLTGLGSNASSATSCSCDLG